jgi:transcriptional regulator with XRE-family HTH domain
VKFTEKLARLTAEGNKTLIAKAAGLPPTAISNYINRGYIPRADTALRIAETLKVPVEWLINDDEDWPPPAAPDKDIIGNVPDGLLMREVSRRLRRAAVDTRKLIEQAEHIDWHSVAKDLLNQPIESPIPKSLAREHDIGISLLFADGAILKFEASHIAPTHWRDLPPVDVPEDELTIPTLLRRLRQLNERPGCAAVQLYFFLTASDRAKSNQTEIRSAREKLKSAIDADHPALENAGSKPRPGGVQMLKGSGTSEVNLIGKVNVAGESLKAESPRKSGPKRMAKKS